MAGIGRPPAAPNPAARACGERWRLLARSQSVSLAWGRIVYIGSDGYVGDHDHLPR
jgi:hypothetical protein